MNHHEIRDALVAQGLNLAMIAEALEVSPVAVGQVTARKTTSRRIATAVASAIGRPIADVFPDVESYRSTPRPVSRQARLQELKASLQLS